MSDLPTSTEGLDDTASIPILKTSEHPAVSTTITPRRFFGRVLGAALFAAALVGGGVWVGTKINNTSNNVVALQQLGYEIKADLNAHTKSLTDLNAELKVQQKGSATVSQILVEAGMAVTALEAQMTQICNSLKSSGCQVVLPPPATSSTTTIPVPTTSTTSSTGRTTTTTTTTTTPKSVSLGASPDSAPATSPPSQGTPSVSSPSPPAAMIITSPSRPPATTTTTTRPSQGGNGQGNQGGNGQGNQNQDLLGLILNLLNGLLGGK